MDAEAESPNTAPTSTTSLLDAGESPDKQGLPPLLGDQSFWGLALTQFLGAFNDNLYKQLMLLLAIGLMSAGKAAGVEDSGAADEASKGGDLQGWATLVFSIPFVLLSGYAGYLSDRYSKTRIIMLCKVAEIGVMFLGLTAFLFYDQLGMAGTWSVLFLMGMHSTFFGPGKYGVLPELFRAKDMTRANGIILMTTFLAIIFGMVLAGGLYDLLVDGTHSARKLWIGSFVCIGIAIVGTISSMMIRPTPPAQPNIKLTPDVWLLSRDVAKLLYRDRPLLAALLVSCVFWLVSGIAVMTVNRLGKSQLEIDATRTSILNGSVGLGIMAGAVLTSLLSRFCKTDRFVTIGLWGIFASLIALGMWSAGGKHVLGFGGSIAALLMMGIFAAIYAVPLQVFLQSRPPADIKGRMIAVMNQANFIGILISGPLYQLFERIGARYDWPISSVFWMMSLLVLPPAILYRLNSNAPSAK
ncbi:MAG: MFS transporter [Pirellulales bacterium]